MKSIYTKNIFAKSFYLLVLMLFVFPSIVGVKSLYSQESLRVFISPPGVLNTNVAGGAVVTETFESFLAVPNNSWAPLPAGYVSAIGTYTQVAGSSEVQADDQYGANTPRYMSISPNGVVRINLTQSVNYFGFAWPAGDANNEFRVLRQGHVIATFTTADIVGLIPNVPANTITASNGAVYNTEDYYGKPVTGQNASEPYGYLHFVATSGLAFDAIELTTKVSGAFENDNHSILIGTPVIGGDWVSLVTVNTPTVVNDSGSGLPGSNITVNVLANDTPGDNAIDPTTVKILGTANSGDPLVVAGEGTWSINPATGAITFTPQPGFTGNPTPIRYSVKDVNGYASNLATLTITYFVGPTAVDDAAVTDVNVAVSGNVLTNDVAGSAAINPATLTFVPGTEPNPATVGTFVLDPLTGIVTFTPVNGFVGVATIDYRVCDANGLCDVATITVTVVAGAVNLYPATGPGTLAFEDLWPNKGDYDFNDLVIDYRFEIITTVTNHVNRLTATFTIQAFGASFENGFGFQLPSVINSNHVTVSGYSLTDGYINLNPNGTEAGQSRPTIIVYDNSFTQMTHPGVGIGVNTDPAAPYVAPKTLTITIDFTPYTYTLNQLDIAHFNPFLIVDKDRSVEVHLPYYPPTDLANQNLLGTGEDASNPGANKYYVTATNLPWAIHIYEKFDYPIEKQDIVNVHLKFAEWATSGGVLFPNWYQNLNGYRNVSLIYAIP